MPTGAEDAAARAVGFLAARQLASGELPTLVVDPAHPDAAVPDAAVFATTLAADALGAVADPRAAAVRRRALDFLAAQAEPPGVWRHPARGHPDHLAIPPDTDDTACASRSLALAGRPVPDNRNVLFVCRDAHGRFRTWIAPRWESPPRSRAFWRVAARRWRSPATAFLFWRRTEADPQDIDGVVNANVLRYLGDGPWTPPVVGFLAHIVRRGQEAGCDKWYRSALAFHHALSRCARRGVSGLEPLREPALARVLAARAGDDGAIGTSALETALGAIALRNWGGAEDELAAARAHLAATQAPDGSWETAPMYYGGPLELRWWGSRELTTSLCLDALGPGLDER